jgi:hypothetical protein
MLSRAVNAGVMIERLNFLALYYESPTNTRKISGNKEKYVQQQLQECC